MPEAKDAVLTGREMLFCDLCARLGNEVEAAKIAGYPEKAAVKSAARLLAREEIVSGIRRRLSAHRTLAEGRALAALERLAFGDRSDAVRLACADDRPGVSGDLFCVSELRRGKDGALEVRFYDRIKAMELLLSHRSGEDIPQGPQSLYSALESSAKALGTGCGDSAV